MIFCEMFGQLTSRFILLEKARQEFADGVLWDKQTDLSSDHCDSILINLAVALPQ